MASEPSAVEQAVSRALRENLESIQNTSDELHRAVSDLVAACASNRALNALPPVVRAQMASASLSATLDVLVRLITAAIQPANRVPVDAETFRLSSSPAPEPLTASNPPDSRFAEPRIAEPKFVEPNFSAPNFAEPSFAEASSVESSVGETIAAEPKFVAPDIAQIRSEEVRSAERTPVAPPVSELKIPEPKVLEPKFVEPKFVAPKIVEPKVVEPLPQVAARITVPVEAALPAQPVQVLQVRAPEPTAPEVPVHPVAPKPTAAQPPRQSPVEAVIEMVVEKVQNSGGLFAALDTTAAKIEPVTPIITQPTILPVTEPVLQSVTPQSMTPESAAPQSVPQQSAIEQAVIQQSVIQPVAVSTGTEDDSLWVTGPELKAEFGATSLMDDAAAPLIPIGNSPEPVPESSAPDMFDITALPIDQQELHRRANRVAKVSMQDIKMLRPDDVRLGRENRDLCRRLRDDIEKAHKEYERRFQTINSHPVDYFYNWMVEILGGGNPEALGEYPYPSVVLHR